MTKTNESLHAEIKDLEAQLAKVKEEQKKEIDSLISSLISSINQGIQVKNHMREFVDNKILDFLITKMRGVNPWLIEQYIEFFGVDSKAIAERKEYHAAKSIMEKHFFGVPKHGVHKSNMDAGPSSDQVDMKLITQKLSEVAANIRGLNTYLGDIRNDVQKLIDRRGW